MGEGAFEGNLSSSGTWTSTAKCSGDDRRAMSHDDHEPPIAQLDRHINIVGSTLLAWARSTRLHQGPKAPRAGEPSVKPSIGLPGRRTVGLET